MKESGGYEDDVFVSLGSNLGDRWEYVRLAGVLMSALPETLITGRSRPRLTRAVGIESQPDFVNRVLRLSTRLEPDALMRELLRAEIRLGRRRRVRWGPRTIDLDILFFGLRCGSGATVTLPHPEVWNRPFLLDMVREIDPDFPVRFRAEVTPSDGWGTG